jgi:hypothetical protein
MEDLLKFLIPALFAALLVSSVAQAQTQPPIRVVCGGSAYSDSKGQMWMADTGYNDGTVSKNSDTIKGTTDATLYHFGRYNAQASNPLTYTFPLPGGTYHVNLYFAETSPGQSHVGGRIFNVKMQDEMVFQNLDVYAEAGAYTALVKSADITATSGEIKIEFDNVVQNPKINAIEIIQTASAPTMKLSFLYSDGSPVIGALNYKLTSTLLSFGGNAPLTNGQATCYLFASPVVLGLAGNIQVDLSLIDSGGHSLWQLSMAMNPANFNLNAVQSSTLNVIVQKQ